MIRHLTNSVRTKVLSTAPVAIPIYFPKDYICLILKPYTNTRIAFLSMMNGIKGIIGWASWPVKPAITGVNNPARIPYFISQIKTAKIITTFTKGPITN